MNKRQKNKHRLLSGLVTKGCYRDMYTWPLPADYKKLVTKITKDLGYPLSRKQLKDLRSMYRRKYMQTYKQINSLYFFNKRIYHHTSQYNKSKKKLLRRLMNEIKHVAENTVIPYTVIPQANILLSPRVTIDLWDMIKENTNISPWDDFVPTKIDIIKDRFNMEEHKTLPGGEHMHYKASTTVFDKWNE